LPAWKNRQKVKIRYDLIISSEIEHKIHFKSRVHKKKHVYEVYQKINTITHFSSVEEAA